MSSERRAILLLLSLAVAGQGIHYLVTRPGQAPGDVRIISTLPAHSAAAQVAAAKAQHRPLASTERIDVNRATPQELTRLPRVGLALAQRIVAHRDSLGAFSGPEDLDRVSGIGPGLLATLGPHLTYGRGTGGRSGPAIVPSAPGLPSATLPVRLNVNTASAREIEALPLIGPSRALAIVAWRERHGSFKDVDDLIKVPGVSRRMVDAIRDRIAFH
jgi:competence protein ComEA